MGTLILDDLAGAVGTPHFSHLLHIRLQLAKEQPTMNNMPNRIEVKTDKAPEPLPVYSQAIVCNGMMYVSLEPGPFPMPARSELVYLLLEPL